MQSIIQDKKECLICKSPYTEEHHVFFGIGNRKLSEKYGLKVHLCPYHHRDVKNGVHGNKALCREIQALAQHAFEKTYTRDFFMELFRRNYIED